ncbi:MAG: dipeptidase E [Lachnospiraceae bacterium]|nr:dipeptidase E [Lachnospiraceae bacterium]
MTLFLTSSFCLREVVGIDPTAGFLDELKARLPRPCRLLFVCSKENDPDVTDLYAASTADCFKREGFFFSQFRILDGRTASHAAEWAADSDLIILSGGHVPTQSAFFTKIGLKDILRKYNAFPSGEGGPQPKAAVDEVPPSSSAEKIVIGISAGTMNCAETVYAMPELDGESLDPAYERFIPGLGLTDISVIPHYDYMKDVMLDGKRAMEDIAYPDSFGREFLVLPDGSYVLIEAGKAPVIRGRAWRLKDGKMTEI